MKMHEILKVIAQRLNKFGICVFLTNLELSTKGPDTAQCSQPHIFCISDDSYGTNAQTTL